MAKQDERKESSSLEGELKSPQSHAATGQHHDPRHEREERLGIWSEDPKLQ